MAFYIKIEKTDEDNEKVIYSFTGDGGNTGIFEINKISGDLNLLEGMPGDSDEAMYRRASIKILKEWKIGNLPNMTEWAS